ncbi:hypothetical protein [Streptomyces parvulus]|uniref:hypothetical protein n=1 Tax=Streptomyces parvulus TaxID=146923 RepID=UPI0037D83EC4
MTLLRYEVKVPMRNHTGDSGLHIFTGLAESRTVAIRTAREAYSAAHTAHRAGCRVPGNRPDGWGASGYRPGWELDWRAATATCWEDRYAWCPAGDVAAA